MKKIYSYLIIFLLLLIGLNFWLTYYIQQKHTTKIEERLELSNKWATNSLTLFFKDMISNTDLLSNELDTIPFDLKTNEPTSLKNSLNTIFSRQNYQIKEIKIYDTQGNFKQLIRNPKTNIVISRYGNAHESRVKNELLLLKTDSTAILKLPFRGHQSLDHIEYVFNLTNIITILDIRCKRDEEFSITLVSADGDIIYTGEDISSLEQTELDRIEALFVTNKETKVLTVTANNNQYLSAIEKLTLIGTTFYLANSIPLDVVHKELFTYHLPIWTYSLILILMATLLFYFYRNENKKRALMIHSSEEALKRVLHLLPVSMMVCGEDNRIRIINKAALKLLEFDLEDHLIGERYNGATIFRKKISAEECERAGSSSKIIYKNGKDEEIIVHIENLPFFIQNEKWNIIVFIEYQRLQDGNEIILESQLAKNAFVANISHELRTPLNGIIGMSEILMDSQTIPEEEVDLLKIINRSASTLLALINDILDFSKIEAGKLEIESLPIDLNSEIEDTIKSFLPKIKEKKLEFNFIKETKLPLDFLGDPIRLRQILNNLFSNAIKFTEQGRIVLNISEGKLLNGNPALHFTLKDTGIGIDMEKINLIFDPFYQADETTTRQYGGTGLGTSITKQLVGMMGGTIWAVSPSTLPNSNGARGSEFHFTLPLQTKNIHKNINFERITEISKIKAVVISDDQLHIKDICNNLSALGVKHTYMTPTQESVDILRSQKKNQLIVIDHRVDLNGLDFLQTLHNHNVTNNYLIVLQSSDNAPMNMNYAKKIGADIYLLKPIKLHILHNFIVKRFTHLKSKSITKSTHSIEDLSVLIAEDNKLNQRVIQSLFGKIGCKITLVENGLEAIKAIESDKFDIIFLDIFMPELDGIATAKQLRETNCKIPIVAMTAAIEAGMRERALTAGINDYITKPIKLDDITRALIKWCMEK